MAYWLVKALLRPVLGFFFRVRVEGAEHVPTSGGAILACNHQSLFDSLLVPLVLRRRVTFLAEAEDFDDPRAASILRALGRIPIDGGGSADRRALESAREVLDRGGLLGIHPERTPSPDGRLHKGHTGIARIALGCHVPVLAVACIGTREAQPPGSTRPRVFMPITIRISKPIDLSGYRSNADDPLVLRKITDQIMFEIKVLGGQEYLNRYAKAIPAVS